jgi:hypothetical protein
MSHTNIIRHAIVCDCADCGAIVDITSFNGVDAFPDIDADRCCPMCGKIVCESCFGDWDTIITEGDDDGGEYVCVECGEKLMAEEAKRKAIAPHQAPNVTDHRADAQGESNEH